jgi:hypothetical protein
MTLKKDQETGILYRENTFDEWILRESRGYFPIGLKSEDRVLDLGGHIGCFAVRCKLENSLIELMALEPEESNFNVLVNNSSEFLFSTVRAAIVSDDLDGKDIDLYVNEKKNNALHSIIPVRGRWKQIIMGYGFIRALSFFKPTIIKCDIEGGEYDLPWESLKDHPQIRKVIMELHLTHKGHRVRGGEMITRMTYLGYHLTKHPRIGEKNWTTMAVWER